MSRESQDALPGLSEIRLVELSIQHELWRGLGSLRLTWSRRAVLLQVNGQGHGEFAKPIIAKWDMALRQSGRVVILCDFWDMPTYDSKLRIDLTNWCIQHRSTIDAIHLAAKSKVVQMGATIANIAL